MPQGRPMKAKNKPLPDNVPETRVLIQELELEKAKLDIAISRAKEHARTLKRSGSPS